MVPFEERLEQFGQKAEASIDELIVLTQSAPVTESTVAAQAVLGRYGRLIAQIGELAAQQQLSGVHAVCALVETNLLLLQDDKRPLTPDESATLEAWPMLLLGYLANRADGDASTALLQSLARHWPITLPLESATDELRLLMGEDEPASPVSAAEEPALATTESAVAPLGEAIHPGVAREAEAILEAARVEVRAEETPFMPVGLDALAVEEPAALTMLQATRHEDAPPIAASLAAADSEETAVLPEPAAHADATMPVSVIALLESQPAALAEPDPAPAPSENIALDQPAPESASTVTVTAYLDTVAPQEPPFAETLAPETGATETGAVETGAADVTGNEALPQAAAPAEPVAENIEREENDAAFPRTLLPPTTGTQHVTRSMLDILLDELQPLNEAFESVITEATHGSNDERLAALGELLDFMERLKLTVETIGLTALAALLTRVKLELVLLPGGLAEHHREMLRRLPRAMVAYLQAPDAPAAAAGLVILLADQRWSTPLAGHTLAAWRAALADIELIEAAKAPTPAQAAFEEIYTAELPHEATAEATTSDAAIDETASDDIAAVAFDPAAPSIEPSEFAHTPTPGPGALEEIHVAEPPHELTMEAASGEATSSETASHEIPEGAFNPAALSIEPSESANAPAPSLADGQEIHVAEPRHEATVEAATGRTPGETASHEIPEGAFNLAALSIEPSESANAPAPSLADVQEIHVAEPRHDATAEAVTGDATFGETTPHDMSAELFSPDALSPAEPAVAAESVYGERVAAEPESDDLASAEPAPEVVPAIVAGDTAFASDLPAALAEIVHAETLADEVPPAEIAPDTHMPLEHEPLLQPAVWHDTAVSADPGPSASAECDAGAPVLPLPDVARQYVELPMVQILLEELQPMSDEFTALVSAATQGAADDKLAALGDLLDFLERVKITVEGIGLTALAALLAQIGMEIVSLPEGLTEQHRALLHGLPDALAAYLRAPDDAAASVDLVALLADSRWPVAASEETRTAWCAALASMELSETSAQMAPARATEATPEDVSLELPAEVNSELLEGLLQELPVQVSAFTSAVASITGAGGTLKDAEHAMRAAHTLKGAANTVGIPGIANLTHHLEDILIALRDAERLPQGHLAEVLIDAGDCLEAMSEFLLGLGTPPDNAQAILQQVLDLANRIDSEGIAELLGEAIAPLPAPTAPDTAPSKTAAAVRPDSGEAEPADPRQQAQTATEQSLRVPAPLVDELISLAGESLISNSQLQDHLKSTIVQSHAVHQQHQLILKLVAELETLVDIRGITSQQQAAAQGEGFDSLEFEHYNELQTISRQLMEATTDAREMSHMAEQELDALKEVLGEQQRLQMANQHALLRTRMMPVSNIIPRLQRSVRQTGRLLDKQVEFTIKGEGTRMDTNVLNDLMDPLMHMLRNAVDHGIEKPDVRLAAGKSPEGHIELAFAREGDTIVVRCRDDGAGLDHEAIRRIAEGKGMITPGHIHTNEELARLILMPGFSTRDEASQISGRGVGMDVVYSRVQEMKGLLALDSQKGKGLTIELRLPATLLSMHALIIRQRERRFAISTRGIEDIRYVPRENVVEIGARQFVRDSDKIYSLLRLEQALAMPHDRRAKDRAGHPVLLLRMEDGSEKAVLVQEVLESREIVMKKFNRFVPQVSGIIGAAILGNGEVAPVIDLFELLHAPVRKFASVQRAQGTGAAAAALEEKPRRALVVDDSLSARRAVVQLLKDEGYEIRTANDGLEAVSVLEKWIPDIIISDMEMPRMNGLELTSNVRHTEQTRDVPVIMITSRSTAKHRQMSAAAGVNLHMIKPFSDEELITQVSKLTEKAQ